MKSVRLFEKLSQLNHGVIYAGQDNSKTIWGPSSVTDVGTGARSRQMKFFPPVNDDVMDDDKSDGDDDMTTPDDRGGGKAYPP